MKKILGISLVALFTAMPMLAKAGVTDAVPGATISESEGYAADREAATASNGAIYSLEAAGSHDDALATGGYVKGAYNAAMKAINKVSVDAKSAAVAAASSAASAAVSGLDATVSTASNAELAVTVVEADGKLTSVTASINSGAVTSDKIADSTIVAADIADSTITKAKLADAVQSSLGKADTALQAADIANMATTAYADSVASAAESAAKSYADTKVAGLDATVSQTTGDLTLSVVESAGKLTSVSGSINAGAVKSTHLATSAVQTAAIADGAVTTDKILDGTIANADIADSTIEWGKLSTAVQSALTNANSALQAADIADMATQSGVLATINASTVPVLTVWGSDSATTIGVKAPASYVEPQSASQSNPT